MAAAAAIWARFFANRSLSPWSTFSRRFMAPGRLLMLFRRMMLTWSLASAALAGAPCSGESPSGSAAASESRVATSFLFGRRCLLRGFLDGGFVILDISAACLMWRLSFFVEGKSDDFEVDGFITFREDEDEDDFFNVDFRGLGTLCIGA